VKAQEPQKARKGCRKEVATADIFYQLYVGRGFAWRGRQRRWHYFIYAV